MADALFQCTCTMPLFKQKDLLNETIQEYQANYYGLRTLLTHTNQRTNDVKQAVKPINIAFKHTQTKTNQHTRSAQ